MPDLLVNDLHSALNPTRVERILTPCTRDEIIGAVRNAARAGASLALSGGRHAMGGQQFAAGAWLLDLRGHAAIRAFDQERGLITVDAGIQWPALIEACAALRDPARPAWGIRQKQTGADRLTLGGALSANVHGRGLRLPPIVGDVESFTLINADGAVLLCSRSDNSRLFSLAIGGYGLFGVIAEITLRLAPRVKVERSVEVLTLDELIRVPNERNTDEWLFGDFQFSIDEGSADFLRRGVFSAYRRTGDDRAIPAAQLRLGAADWLQLIELAHIDRAQAFEEYARYYLSTSGQVYWSDTHQLSNYVDNYHAVLDRRLHSTCPGSEMITELYVPRTSLAAFMGGAGELLRLHGPPVIYGTIRLIERDEESFLAWAREPWACIIFNLHVEHTAAGLAVAAVTFRSLIDLAISFSGSYFLTYHRWATKEQVEAGHPRFAAFFEEKLVYDPAGRFTSDWYRHQRALFEGALALPSQLW